MNELYIILAFFAGWWLHSFFSIRRILRNPDKMIELLQKYKEAKDEVEEDATELDDITPMDIERVNNVYYAYSAEGEFLAQGNDFRSMFENIKNRFPNKSFKIGKYQPNLTEEETGKLVKSIFEVFGNDKTLNK